VHTLGRWALQRMEGGGDRRSPPLGGPCGLSWGCVALRGLGSGGPGRTWVPPAPCGVSTPVGGSCSGTSHAAEAGAGPPCAFVPLQRPVPRTPHRGVAAPTRRPGDPPRDAASRGLSFPTTRTRSAVPHEGGGSLRRRVPRPRFGYLLRGVHRRPCRRSRRRSVHGILPSRLRSSRTMGAPLGVPALLTLPAARFPGRKRTRPAAFRASFPRRVRARHRVPEGTRPPMPSWASPLQSIPPIRPGHRFWSRRRPSRPRAGRRPCPPGPQGFADRMGRPGPSPDCRLSWGFAPCDRHGAPSTGPGSGCMG
jgi:hypothetical protein